MTCAKCEKVVGYIQGWHDEIVNAIEAQKARGRGGMQVPGPALSYAQPSVLRICERHLRYALRALLDEPPAQHLNPWPDDLVEKLENVDFRAAADALAKPSHDRQLSADVAARMPSEPPAQSDPALPNRIRAVLALGHTDADDLRRDILAEMGVDS